MAHSRQGPIVVSIAAARHAIIRIILEIQLVVVVVVVVVVVAVSVAVILEVAVVVAVSVYTVKGLACLRIMS